MISYSSPSLAAIIIRRVPVRSYSTAAKLAQHQRQQHQHHYQLASNNANSNSSSNTSGSPLDFHVNAYKESMSRIGSQAMILTSAISRRKNLSIGDTKFNADASTSINDENTKTGIPISDLHGLTLSSVVSLSVKPRTLIQFNLQVPSSTSSKLHQHEWFAIHLLPPNENSVRLARNFSRGVRWILKSKNVLSASKQQNALQAQSQLKSLPQLQSPSALNFLATQPFLDLLPDEYLFTSQIYSRNPAINNSSNKQQDQDESPVQKPEQPVIPYYSSSPENHTSMRRQLLKTCQKSDSETEIEIPLLQRAERIFICAKDKVFKVDDHEIWVAEVRDILSHSEYHHANSEKKTGGLVYFDRRFYKLGETLKEPAKEKENGKDSV